MAATPNADQIAYWSGSAGPRWVALQPMLDAQIDALGRVAMGALGVQPGWSVIDVGCGCGQTTLELAERVGSAGRVLGVDVSPPMLARAGERVAAAGHTGVQLQQGDAQVHGFPPAAADAVFSRFGVMFFEDPAAAFRNLHRALRPGGRLGFICWQSLDRNPWMGLALRAAAAHVALPAPPPPGGPGPFSFADPERVRGLLEAAGFVRIRIEPYESTMGIGAGATLERSVEDLLQLAGPVATALRDADPVLRARVHADVCDAVRPWYGADGLCLPSAAWIVTAERP